MVHYTRPARKVSHLKLAFTVFAGALFLFVAVRRFALQPVAFAAGTRGTYTTKFPATENPISENGNWINGGTVGLDWHNCATTPGFAYGTQPATKQYDDSTCLVNGSWGPNQTVQVTVSIPNPSGLSGASFEEVEIRLRSNITAHNNTGYEINCSVKPGQSYIQVVRWNGPLATTSDANNGYTSLTGTSGNCVNGDVLKASMIGNVISVYRNDMNHPILTTTDNTYSSGQPGIGMYIEAGSASTQSSYGISSFSASDGTSSAQNPAAPTNLTAIVQ